MHTLPRSIDRLKQEAKLLCKSAKSEQASLSRSAALELVAQKYNFPNWKAVLKTYDDQRAVGHLTPPVSVKFLDDDDVIQDSDCLDIVERSTDLPLEDKVRIAKNKEVFAKRGVEFSVFEPTITGLKKSILDATRPVRSHFESENFHLFETQGQGKDHKVKRKAHFVADGGILSTEVSLYRPVTKKGDPRMWFKGLPSFAEPTNQIAIVIFEGELYLFNLSQIVLFASDPASAPLQFLERYVQSKNGVANGLLLRLKEIAKKPIRAVVSGDTAVGMAVEHALGIVANSSQQPDYNGIELKAGRGNKNRTTLFAQVPDWGVSRLKSSAYILDEYGYQRGDDFKLYCTISTQRTNSQGLKFFYDESADQLIEKDRNGKEVAVWPGSLLRDRLLKKHAETFWIEATSITVDGVEHFLLKSVTHTKRPLVSQLLPLIESGVITMDHLIKRKGGNKPSVTEKGPLFKINKRDLSFLFPEPKTYLLK